VKKLHKIIKTQTKVMNIFNTITYDLLIGVRKIEQSWSGSSKTEK